MSDITEKHEKVMYTVYHVFSFIRVYSSYYSDVRIFWIVLNPATIQTTILLLYTIVSYIVMDCKQWDDLPMSDYSELSEYLNYLVFPECSELSEYLNNCYLSEYSENCLQLSFLNYQTIQNKLTIKTFWKKVYFIIE